MSKELRTTIQTSFIKVMIPLIGEVAIGVASGYFAVWMMAQYSDNLSGAISVANQLLNLFLLLFSIISGGAGILMTQAVGASAHDTKNKITTVSILFSIGAGLIGTILMFAFSSWFFSFYSLAEDVLQSSIDYSLIIAAYFPIQAVAGIYTQILYAHGETKFGVYSSVVAVVIQLIATYALLFGIPELAIPELGVAGVAIGWIIGRAIYFGWAYLFVHHHLKVRFSLASLQRSQKGLTRKMFFVGIPSTIENFSYNLMMLFITAVITTFGTQAITAKSYFDTLAQASYFIGASAAGVVGIFVGQFVGSKEFEKAQVSVSYAIRLSLITSIIPAIFLASLMGIFAAFFTQNPEEVALMGAIAVVDIFLEIGRALNMIYGRALKSAGDARFPLIVGFVVEWGMSLWLAFYLGQTLGWGLLGVWIAFAIDECFRGLILAYRWKSQRWKTKGLIHREATEQKT